MTTSATNKFSLPLAIALVAVTARATGARRIARVNDEQANAGQARFVVNEDAKLRKRPIRMLCPMLAKSVADAGWSQFFNFTRYAN